MDAIAPQQLKSFLAAVGARYPRPATLVLLGGSALCLLGSHRPTLDIDYVGDDLHKNELQNTIEQISQELRIPVDAVPIEQFLPVPTGANERRLLIGQFGNLEVYVLDPYTIALSKLDRGFETDIEDILFLLHHNLITIGELERVALNALRQASGFDLNTQAIRAHLQTVRALLG